MMHQRCGEYASAFLFGFFVYTLLEIAGRGRTHWTMGLLGGAALAVLYSMEYRLRAGHFTRALLGALFVTASEFAAGVLDNLILGWAVWDYSDCPFNLLGQICPLFSGIWFLLCYLASLFCTVLYRQFHPCAAAHCRRTGSPGAMQPDAQWEN